MLRTNSTKPLQANRSNKHFWLALIAIACLHLVLIALLGAQKQGFFIDEYFTHTLSNNPRGLNLQITDYAWNDPAQLLRQLAVVPGEPDSAFNYARVMTNNAADVHPPLYYLLFHTLCSFAPGLFSKWIGILLNVPFSLGCLALVASLAWQFSRSHSTTLLAAFVYACNPGALSNALLIRMYCMLSFFVLLAIWLHALVLRGTFSFRMFAPCIATVYFCGFMTQYYFILFAGLLSGACFLLWLCTARWKQALLYAGTLFLALGATYRFYPAWVQHIFTGYRGVGAAQNLVKDDTVFKLTTFLGEVNAVVFAYCLPALILALAMLVSVCVWQRRACGLLGLARVCVRTPTRRFALTLGAICCVSFFILAKISGVTERNFSVRYFFLLFAPVLLLLCVSTVWLLCRAGVRRCVAAACVGLLFACVNVFGLLNGSSVEYLFTWDKQLLENAQANQDTTVVLMHNATLFVGMANQLMQYDQFFPIGQIDPQPVPDDERLTEVTRLLLYMEKKDDPLATVNKAPLEEHLPYLRKNFPQLPNIRELPSPVYHYQLFELSA